MCYMRKWPCGIRIKAKTCLYNIDPLKSHFYIVKLRFAAIYIVFLISAQKHRLWVLDRTASARRCRGGSNEYPQSMFWAEIWKISYVLSENFQFFFVVKFSIYLNRHVFIIECPDMGLPRSCIYTTVCTDSVSRQWIPWSDRLNVHAELVLHCLTSRCCYADLNLPHSRGTWRKRRLYYVRAFVQPWYHGSPRHTYFHQAPPYPLCTQPRAHRVWARCTNGLKFFSTRAGIEPTTFRLQVDSTNHKTIQPTCPVNSSISVFSIQGESSLLTLFF